MLNLNQVWWLVATQNPLKLDNQKINILQRLNSAVNLKKNRIIKPQALEFKIKTKFSYDTVKYLKMSMPRINFFWIMGSDNLCIMHKWYKWKKLFYLCPIIVFNRPGYFYNSLNSKAAKYFWNNKIETRKIKITKKLPAWTFINIRPNYISSTFIRNNKIYER